MSDRKVSVMSNELKAMSALDRSLKKILEYGDMAETLVSFVEKRLAQIKAEIASTK